MDNDKDLYVFAGKRWITAMFKHDLDLLEEIRKEHDNNIDKLRLSLQDYEDFLHEKGVDVELAHLAGHADYFDQVKYDIYRKRILDYGNSLRREAEQL